MPHQAAPFIVVGMIACFGSIAHAPLAVMLMVVEMTGSVTVLAPAMVAVGLATLVVGEATIYRSQLKSRAESPAHRLRAALPLLSLTSAKEAMVALRLVLDADKTVAEAAEALLGARLSGAPVQNREGRFCGIVTLGRLADLPDEETVGRHADSTERAVDVDETLDIAAERISLTGSNWLPVLDNERVVVILGMTELIGGYRRALATSLRRLTETGRTVLVEERVGEESDVSGDRISEVAWSPGTVIISVERDGQLVLVTGGTRLQAGDLVSALSHPETAAALRARLSGEAETDRSLPVSVR